MQNQLRQNTRVEKKEEENRTPDAMRKKKLRACVGTNYMAVHCARATRDQCTGTEMAE